MPKKRRYVRFSPRSLDGIVRHCLKFKKTKGGMVRCVVFKPGYGSPALTPLLKCKNLRSLKHIRPNAKRCAVVRRRK